MNGLVANRSGGITLIELIISLAVLSVVLSGAHSWFDNHVIRSKIAEAVAVTESAKTAVIVTCTEDPDITALTNSAVGYSLPGSLYVKDVSVSGSCALPIITILTANTGLLIDPTLTIAGDNSIANGQSSWTCVSDGLDMHVPDTCSI